MNDRQAWQKIQRISAQNRERCISRCANKKPQPSTQSWGYVRKNSIEICWFTVFASAQASQRVRKLMFRRCVLIVPNRSICWLSARAFSILSRFFSWKPSVFAACLFLVLFFICHKLPHFVNGIAIAEFAAKCAANVYLRTKNVSSFLKWLLLLCTVYTCSASPIGIRLAGAWSACRTHEECPLRYNYLGFAWKFDTWAAKCITVWLFRANCSVVMSDFISVGTWIMI